MDSIHGMLREYLEAKRGNFSINTFCSEAEAKERTHKNTAMLYLE